MLAGEKRKKITILLLGAVGLALLGWDVFVAWHETDLPQGTGGTISEVMLFLSRHPLVPFSFGVVTGHFFWPQRVKESPP